jgi:hypothetical protein
LASQLLDPTNPRLNYGPSQINRPHIFMGSIVYNTPQMVGQNTLVRGVLGGWELAAILGYTSGSSMTVYAQQQPHLAGWGNTGGISGTGSGPNNVRPNIVPGQPCRAPTGSLKYQWLNPNRWTLIGYRLDTFGDGSIGDCLSRALPIRTLPFTRTSR